MDGCSSGNHFEDEQLDSKRVDKLGYEGVLGGVSFRCLYRFVVMQGYWVRGQEWRTGSCILEACSSLGGVIWCDYDSFS